MTTFPLWNAPEGVKVPSIDTRGVLRHSPLCAFDPEGVQECDCGLEQARVDAACMDMEFENRG